MYTFIRGKLVYASPLYCIVETGGLGYKLPVAANAFSKMPQVGEEVLLHTSFQVREASHTLYGFMSEQERDLFELLINVSGIGPKLGLSIIGHLSFNDLRQAITQNEIVKLCKIPGIGKKTAERLIIETRDKLDGLQFEDFSIPSVTAKESQTVLDAMSAMIHLGYNQSTAQKAVKKSLADLPDNPDLALLITHSLTNV